MIIFLQIYPHKLKLFGILNNFECQGVLRIEKLKIAVDPIWDN